MKSRLVSIVALLQVCLIAPTTGLSQVDTLVDCFPLSVGNQWTYAFDHEKVLDTGGGFEVTTDTGRVQYTVLGKTDFPDSVVWEFRESRNLRHRVTLVGVTISDSLIADSTVFDLVELNTGRHQLFRQITDQGLLWSTVFPFMRDMSDTTQVYRYWNVDSSFKHMFLIRYPSPSPFVSYTFTVARDSGLVSLAALNAITFPGYERANHHLVAWTLTGIGNKPESVLPRMAVLKQNFPNPFNPKTIIQYELPIGTDVQVDVVNILGELVVRLVDQNMLPGHHQVQFDGHTLSSGTYLLVLKTRGRWAVRKMLLIR